MTTIIKGYKSADNYIIELDIDTINTHNNLTRYVTDKNHAKYRCDKAFVRQIYNKFPLISGQKEEIDSIKSDFDPSFIYKKGVDVHSKSYDNDINAICTCGIHFYLSEETAYFHNIHPQLVDVYREWYADGGLCTIINYKNGKKEGLHEHWYENRLLSLKCNYKNDKMEGLYERWYKNGLLSAKCNYVNDIIEGISEQWYENGQLYIKCNYVDGKIEGIFEQWYANGNLYKKSYYMNGIEMYEM